MGQFRMPAAPALPPAKDYGTAPQCLRTVRICNRRGAQSNLGSRLSGNIGHHDRWHSAATTSQPPVVMGSIMPGTLPRRYRCPCGALEVQSRTIRHILVLRRAAWDVQNAVRSRPLILEFDRIVDVISSSDHIAYCGCSNSTSYVAEWCK